MTPRPVRILMSLLALALVVAPAASASSTQESIFEDDYQVLQLGPDEQRRALDDFLALGADTVRSLVLWNQIAPDPGSTRRPKGFDGRNPAHYNPGLWDRYDDLVRGVQARGMGLLFSPSSPIPAWGSDCSGSATKRRTCKPDPKLFGAFMQALGTRYSGEYQDENQGGGVLPRVERGSIWNEPNQPGWLTPQYESKGGRKVATAAHRYRALVTSAIRALRATGHGSDQILLGETAPIGRTSGTLARRPIPPVNFIREVLCINSRGAKLRTAECRSYRKLSVRGFAHHPYTRGGSQPPRAATAPGEITVSTAGRLKKLLSQGGRARRIPRNLPIYYTEFGYQTNPPDRLFGVKLEQQAEYINEADWIAYQDSRVKAVAQYKLFDEPNVASFQTGLRFVSGELKPAFDAYRLPIWVSRRGSSVRVYGQVRPSEDDVREIVAVQNDASGSFQTVQEIEVLSRKGHFLVTLPNSGSNWRLVWTPSDGGATLTSRVARVARR